MAWMFSLSAECGSDQSTAEQFAQHFEASSLPLSNGSQSQCYNTIFQDISENWWCRICPDGMSEIGVEAPEAAYSMTELGLLLYQHLRSAPPFRYALVGIEVDEFRTFDELLDESSTLHVPGLVLSTSTWQSIGEPTTFRAFSSGYVWQLYEGEAYKPLTVSPSLKEQMNRLLAA